VKIQQRLWQAEVGWKSLHGEDLKEDANLVLVFGGISIIENMELLKDVQGFYPKAFISGCSASGEILQTQVYDDSLSVTAIALEKSFIKAYKTEIKSMAESLDAGVNLASQIEKDGLKHVLMLTDGALIKGDDFIAGFRDNISPDVAVTGGLASDNGAFKKTFVVYEGSLYSGVAIAICFYGESLQVGYGSRGGWDSFGPDKIITKSEGNILYEVENQPALDLYKKYLGEEADGLPQTGLYFPLMILKNPSDKGVVRTVMAVNQKDGSLIFGSDIPQGGYARLMKANFERLIDGSAAAAEDCAVNLPQDAELAILISCVARKLVLKQRTEEEVEAAIEILGDNIAITGFYSNGEICPNIPTIKHCEFHNQTMTITTISEK